MKNKLWRLIEYYLDKKIDEVVFCSNFFLLYVHEIDYNDFDDQEQNILSELSEVAGRFSPYEEDHIETPGAFYTKQQLAEKILETKTALMKIHPEYFE
ncbi:MAG: hypothetical protein NT065_04610 [Chlamydiae bacterium]|nr:hypothetical protein [Chlamydiota bacterium]